ncbi:MAG: hypothetical protein ACHP7F_11415 [Actinomycetales bacterium]
MPGDGLHQYGSNRVCSISTRHAQRPPAVNGIDVALVRDGRIARLYTILTAES